MREVKAGDLTVHKAPLLRDVGAEHFTKRLMHDVRHGVVARDGCARCLIDLRVKHVTGLKASFLDVRGMPEDTFLDAEGVRDLQERRAVFKDTDVTDLAAHLSVKGRLVKHHNHVVACSRFFNLRTVTVKRKDLGLRFVQGLVTLKRIVFTGVKDSGRNLKLTGSAGLGLLFVHCLIKGFDVNLKTAFAADVGGEVNREAVGVVQLKGDIAVKHAVLGFGNGGFENFHAVA